ncbi:MAG TPA: type II secretion system protein GspG [Candidatus Sulfotelmatobacter sp.]|nr:type II secretion system protein GspG [Candidatus Sulfotelmatobacter sp.]
MILEIGKHKHNKPLTRCPVTQIELVLLIALLIATAVIVVPRLLDLSGASAQQVSNMQALPALKEIETALAEFDVDNGVYPKGLQDLIQRPGNARNWHGPYLESLPVDPRGNAYFYSYPGKHNPAGYDLWSAGPDGKSGDQDDIGNRQNQ